MTKEEFVKRFTVGEVIIDRKDAVGPVWYNKICIKSIENDHFIGGCRNHQDVRFEFNNDWHNARNLGDSWLANQRDVRAREFVRRT